MRKNISISLFILLLCMSFLGCKNRRLAKRPTSVSTNISNRLDAIHAAMADFETISIKAKADFVIGNNQNNANISIRIQKDQAIWMSVTVFAGLEVARVLIKPDSIKVLNRLDNWHLNKPFSFIHQYVNQEVNFNTLQSILLGNASPDWINNTSANVSLDGNQTQIRGGVNSLIYNLQFNEWNKLTQTEMNDASANQSLLINYGDFEMVSERNIPRQINLESKIASSDVQLSLRYGKININEKIAFPFGVPKRFSDKN